MMDEEKILELVAIEHRKQSLKIELDEVNKREEELKTAIMADMVQNEIEIFETEDIRIKYVAPVLKNTIDTSRIMREYPEIAQSCLKVVEQKATWKLTLKGE